MVDESAREARLIVPDQRDTIFSRNIFCSNDHEFVPLNAGREGDFLDAAARNAAAHRRPEEHVRQNHIVDVARPSGYLVAPFLARNRAADNAIRFHLATFIFECSSKYGLSLNRIATAFLQGSVRLGQLKRAAWRRGWDSV